MNLNDLNEAPMGLLKRMGHKVLSKVPGSIGQTAQGKLDTGRVSNLWKQEYMKFLGQIGEKNPSTENLSQFLRSKGLTPDQLVAFVRESSTVYERVLTSREVDAMILKAAQVRAGQGVGKKIEPTIGPPGSGAPQAAPATPRSMPNLTPSAAAPAAKPAADPNALKTDAQGGYVRKWANDIANATSREEKVALAKEMINFLSDRKGSPEGSRAANAVAALAQKSRDPVLSKMLKPVRALRMERKFYALTNKLLESVGLTWKDLDMKISLSESTIDYVVIICY